MERKLASIQRIVKLEPIEGADAIEKATVLGWSVVVKRNEFQIGDLVVYCEIDSLLPEDNPAFAFLEKVKYRIKTVRLRGQISQGICFPVSILGDFPPTHIMEGEDVTEVLGIKKYELPVPAQLAGKIRGNFPGFLPKTDEPRLQAFPNILERYKDIKFFMTEKLDGSSCTFVVKNDEFHVCSRNLDLLETKENTIWRVAREMDIESKIRKMNEKLGEERIAFQGEIVGEKIQNNPLGIKGQTIYFFNIYNFISGNYYNFEAFTTVAKLLKLPTVPIVETNIHLKPTVDQMVGYILDRRSQINPDAMPEGYVFRPRKEIKDEDLGRLSFKVINPEYLLKRGE